MRKTTRAYRKVSYYWCIAQIWIEHHCNCGQGSRKKLPTSRLLIMSKNIHQCHGLVGVTGKHHAGPGLGLFRRALSAAFALLSMHPRWRLGGLVDVATSALGQLDLTGEPTCLAKGERGRRRGDQGVTCASEALVAPSFCIPCTPYTQM